MLKTKLMWTQSKRKMAKESSKAANHGNSKEAKVKRKKSWKESEYDSELWCGDVRTSLERRTVEQAMSSAAKIMKAKLRNSAAEQVSVLLAHVGVYIDNIFLFYWIILSSQADVLFKWLVNSRRSLIRTKTKLWAT